MSRCRVEKLAYASNNRNDVSYEHISMSHRVVGISMRPMLNLHPQPLAPLSPYTGDTELSDSIQRTLGSCLSTFYCYKRISLTEKFISHSSGG